MTDLLTDYLEGIAADGGDRARAAAVVAALARAAPGLHHAIACDAVPAAGGETNSHGEVQKPLDLHADAVFHAAAEEAPVAFVASEEREAPSATGRPGVALAFDPLDGSSNIETNIAVGTIFSILPALPGDVTGRASFTQPGTAQLAAGFFVYGAQLLLVVTFGDGTRCFGWNPDLRAFARESRFDIPPRAAEYALNGANRRHWSAALRGYVRGLESGAPGPRGQDFGMRYAGSLVADCYRILRRGGVFLYPADARAPNRNGRLRQLYEANPIAFCIEQAGGAASDGHMRLMERAPADIHARVPLVFGSRDEIAHLAAILGPANTSSEAAPERLSPAG